MSVQHPAVRGQAFAMPFEHSYAMLAGGTVRKTTWRIAYVDSIDREGRITAFRIGWLDDPKHPGKTGYRIKGSPSGALLIDPKRYPPAMIRAATKARESDEFESIDEVRAFVLDVTREWRERL